MEPKLYVGQKFASEALPGATSDGDNNEFEVVSVLLENQCVVLEWNYHYGCGEPCIDIDARYTICHLCTEYQKGKEFADMPWWLEPVDEKAAKLYKFRPADTLPAPEWVTEICRAIDKMDPGHDMSAYNWTGWKLELWDGSAKVAHNGMGLDMWGLCPGPHTKVEVENGSPLDVIEALEAAYLINNKDRGV